MRSVMIAAAVAAGLAGGLAATGAPAQQAEVRRLTVTGEGAVAAAPDLARATFGVTLRAATAAEAFAQADAAMAGVMEAARAAGVAQEDLRTVELSLRPVHAGVGDEPARVVAHEARRRVTATVRDLSRLGALLDAAAQAGATDFDGVAFDLDDRRAALEQARAAAVQDAAMAARTLADAAGVTLGEPLSIALGGGFVDAPYARMSAMEAGSVAPGMLAVTAMVTVVYALE